LNGRCPADLMPLRERAPVGLAHVKQLLNSVVPPTHDVDSVELDRTLESIQEQFQSDVDELVVFQENQRSIRRRLWDKKHNIKEDPNLVVGAYVMLSREGGGPYPVTKMSTQWYGPHEIVEIVNPNTVRVKLTGSDLIETAVIDRIRFIDGSDIDSILEFQQFADRTRPGDNVVQKVVGHSKRGKNIWQLQVEWLDGTTSNEPITKFYYDVPHLVDKYLDDIMMDPLFKLDVIAMRKVIQASIKRRKQG